MSKSVLVPLDGSKRSETILPALDAVCASGDEIVLISVGSPSKPQQVGVEQSGDVLLSSSNLGMGSTFATPHEEPVYAESGGQALQRATGRRSRSPGSDEGSSRQRRYRALDRNLFADSCGDGRLVGCRTPKQRSGSDRFGQPRSPAGPVTAVTARNAPSPVS